ncbi:hypothetical protein [Streptomyces europaeiscabiei]|uniref:hypothetical protein n=1 Tax=Streptomyces europaeiscabiei TaxID=146819 RepID=UPI002E254B91|nr:hypothetical protein OG858_47615 [Streptomyces europaeiscabiei]
MAVMTAARTQKAPTADYSRLTHLQQDKFDEVMDEADVAGDNTTYRALMRIAALIAGITLPASGEIRRCGCSCYCGVIFDPTHADAHVIEESGGYNLGRVQCPDCADAHRESA